jgi:hypothetical protein
MALMRAKPPALGVLWDDPADGSVWTVEGIDVESESNDEATIAKGRRHLADGFEMTRETSDRGFECVGPLYYIRHHDDEGSDATATAVASPSNSAPPQERRIPGTAPIVPSTSILCRQVTQARRMHASTDVTGPRLVCRKS